MVGAREDLVGCTCSQVSDQVSEKAKSTAQQLHGIMNCYNLTLVVGLAVGAMEVG